MTCAALHTPCTAAHQYPCLVMVAHPKFHHESNYLLGEVQVPQHVVFVGETFLLKIGQSLSRADGRSDIFQNIFGHAISFAWPGFPR